MNILNSSHTVAEFCWAHVKTHVRLNKTESKLLHVKELIDKKMDDLTTDDWKGYCKRVDAFHREMWKREVQDREILQDRWQDDDMELCIDDSDDNAE